MMKRSILLIIFFSLLVFACEDNNGSNEDLNTVNQNDKKPLKITEKVIEEFEYNDYALSDESEKEIADWEKYQELAIQVSYLKKADLSFFSGETNLITEFIEEFKTNVPNDLKTNPILSRVAVLETAMYRLNASLRLDNIEPSEKLMSVKAVLVAFSNLNYQINKKLERDLYDKITAE